MARRRVVTTTMFTYKRSKPDSPYLGWGRQATRKESTKATSPRLLAYRKCIASQLNGQTYDNLRGIQQAFRTAAGNCARQAASEETSWQGTKPKGFTHKY